MRAVRPLLIMLTVLCVLFVAVDRITVALAESEAESRFKSAEGLDVEPDVSIKGFPFLTQVFGKKLDTVRASAEGLEAGNGQASVRVARFTADLHDVRLTDNFKSAVADTLTGTVLISYADLNDVAPDGVSVAYAGRNASTGGGEVKVTGSVSFLGRTWARSVVSEVNLKGGDTISLRAKDVPGVDIPGLEEFVRKRIDFSEKVTGLPSSIALDRVSAGPDGVTITLTGTDVSLTG